MSYSKASQHELIRAWASFRPRSGPNVLAGDEILLDPPTKSRLTVCYRSWRSLSNATHFGASDCRLHLSLIPQPFFGNIDEAPIVILTLNPGLHLADYYGEQFVSAYRRALVANLRLRNKDTRYPNIFLSPTFCWHSGFSYWHGRLARLIDKFAEQTKVSRLEALALFSKSIATLELMPYHSSSFSVSNRVLSKLRSVALARAYVNDVLLPRVRASKLLLIVVRQAERWGLRRGKGIVVYEGSETRAAHLTPRSRGGRAILRHLYRTRRH